MFLPFFVHATIIYTSIDGCCRNNRRTFERSCILILDAGSLPIIIMHRAFQSGGSPRNRLRLAMDKSVRDRQKRNLTFLVSREINTKCFNSTEICRWFALKTVDLHIPRRLTVQNYSHGGTFLRDAIISYCKKMNFLERILSMKIMRITRWSDDLSGIFEFQDYLYFRVILLSDKIKILKYIE